MPEKLVDDEPEILDDELAATEKEGTELPEPEQGCLDEHLERRDRSDPVRLYLREIGEIDLLTWQEEIALGKRIEAARKGIALSAICIPSIVEELIISAQTKEGFAEIFAAPRDTGFSSKQLSYIRRGLSNIESLLASVRRQHAKKTRRSASAVASAEKQVVRIFKGARS